MKNNVKNKKGLATTILAFVVLAIILAIMDTSMNSVVKIGYVGNELPGHWSGSYMKLDGVMKKSMRADDGEVNIEVTTEEGSISIEIIDQNGYKIFDEENIDDESFTIAAEGKLNVTITATQHKGSFDIAC